MTKLKVMIYDGIHNKTLYCDQNADWNDIESRVGSSDGWIAKGKRISGNPKLRDLSNNERCVDLVAISSLPINICGLYIDDKTLDILSMSETERLKNSIILKEKYEDKLPIILLSCEYYFLDDVASNKFLMPKVFSISDILIIVRKKLTLPIYEALYAYGCKVSGSELHDIEIKELALLKSDAELEEAHQQYASTDGFLYIAISDEKTYG